MDGDVAPGSAEATSLLLLTPSGLLFSLNIAFHYRAWSASRSTAAYMRVKKYCTSSLRGRKLGTQNFNCQNNRMGTVRQVDVWKHLAMYYTRFRLGVTAHDSAL